MHICTSLQIGVCYVQFKFRSQEKLQSKSSDQNAQNQKKKTTMSMLSPEERARIDAELLRRNKAQRDEALGAVNRWFAAVNLGKNPNDRDCMEWYAEHGGAENFATHYGMALAV